MPKRKLYLTLDTETATLPFADQIARNAKEKQNIAIAKPLIYDIGWCIHDSKGRILTKRSFLVNEIFSVPAVFNTAYYKDKRPLYLQKIREKQIEQKNWSEIREILFEDLRTVDYCCAANAMFDYKKAIPFTEQYMYHLYNDGYQEWEDGQRQLCEQIARGRKFDNPREFNGQVFNFQGIDFPMIDIWGVACESLIDNAAYKKKCLENGEISASGMYFKTSVEAVFKYLVKNYDFGEDHMAIEDVMIELQILAKALRKGKITHGIIPFPFKILGTTVDFLTSKEKGLKREYYELVASKIWEKILTYETHTGYVTQMEAAHGRIQWEKDRRFGVA